MKVLVADDDAVFRRLLQATLTGWNYQVTSVVDGSDAWHALQPDDAPDLVILDWEMPGLDGDHLCRLIRQRPRDRYTYVLLITSRSDRADLLRGLEAGADDYLTKPFDPAELRARLNTGRRILHLQNELIAAREAMRRQATRDALTGTWNHAAIVEILDRERGRATRESRSLGVVLADLDHFKRINDTFGHLAGDATLREISCRLSNALRPYDLLGRYGGEEFLIVLPGCDAAETEKICERLRVRVAEQPIAYEGREIAVTLSLGASVFAPPCEDNSVGLVRAADAALYRAKGAGRDRVEVACAW